MTISKKPDKEWIMVGHIPDSLAKILFPFIKTWKIYSTKTIISKNHRAAPKGKWVPRGGTLKSHVITNILEQKSIQNLLERKKQWMLITLLFFDSFFHLTQLSLNGLICGWFVAGGLILGPCFSLVKRWVYMWGVL